MSEEPKIRNTPTEPGVYIYNDQFNKNRRMDVRLCYYDNQLRIEAGHGAWVGCFAGTWEKVGE